MFVKWNDPSVRLVGRWSTEQADFAQTTAPGSSFEVCFSGSDILLHFDTSFNQLPFPHLWLIADGGTMTEAAVDRYIRVRMNGKPDAVHTLQVVMKSAVETQARWYQQLTAQISFKGADVEKPVTPKPCGKKQIEFIGDSITEGVAVDPWLCPYRVDVNNRVYQDDVCATYGWLTAQAFGMDCVNTAYSATGVTCEGWACVPCASRVYRYNFYRSPITHRPSDYVVINHGANDRPAEEKAYCEGYIALLREVRRYNPQANIIALSAFCGAFETELRTIVEDYNRESGDSVFYLDGAGWVPAEPLHPLRDGHKKIAENLIHALDEKYGLRQMQPAK